MPDKIVFHDLPLSEEDESWLTTPEMVWIRRRAAFDGRKPGPWPVWSTGEVAKTFYGISRETLHNYLVEHPPTDPDTGHPLEIPRAEGLRKPYRWQLFHIERYAGHLVARGKFDHRKWAYTRAVIAAVARQHRFL